MKFNLEPLVNYILDSNALQRLDTFKSLDAFQRADASQTTKGIAIWSVRQLANTFGKKMASRISNNQSLKAQKLQLADEQVDGTLFIVWPIVQDKDNSDTSPSQLIIRASLRFLSEHKDLLEANIKRNPGNYPRSSAKSIIDCLKSHLL